MLDLNEIRPFSNMIVSPTHENIVVLSIFASSSHRCVTRAVPTPP